MTHGRVNPRWTLSGMNAGSRQLRDSSELYSESKQLEEIWVYQDGQNVPQNVQKHLLQAVAAHLELLSWGITLGIDTAQTNTPKTGRARARVVPFYENCSCLAGLLAGILQTNQHSQKQGHGSGSEAKQ